MRSLFLLILLSLTLSLNAQQSALKGSVADEQGNPLPYATVVLLLPTDSTLANYGITDNSGTFEIRNIPAASYILQASYLGYQTLHQNLSLPLSKGNSVGTLILKARPVNLGAVDISAEHIPMLIKKDTIEYNAAAFKTRTDAVAEELLKKLPGVEVDRSGNIKAQGEDVTQVLVDGKEFFSNDPKVATKNLPAEAVDKVQVYNKKSDESELTGIEDGSYEKTINMILKSGKKSAWFGNVEAGGGTDDHFQTAARIFHFTPVNQFAVLGMLNNINKFGFTFSDYIDFSGGMGALMNGGEDMRITLEDDGSLPMDFGQSINGLVTSGAAGINYTHEFRKHNRMNISYMGSGTDKNLEESSESRNFTPSGFFLQNSITSRQSSQRSNRINLGWRNRLDSTRHFNLNGSLSLSQSSIPAENLIASYFDQTLQNTLESTSNAESGGLSSTLNGSFLKKLTGNWRVFRLSANAAINHSLTENEWRNLTRYFTSDTLISDNRYQNNLTDKLNLRINTSAMYRLAAAYSLETLLEASVESENFQRDLGFTDGDAVPVDSLSPRLNQNISYLQPGLALKYHTSKTRFHIGLAAEITRSSLSLNEAPDQTSRPFAFLPSMNWEHEFSRGRRLNLFYSTALLYPSASQLNPVADNSNSLELIRGNLNLKPEYNHRLNFNWMWFDQFSFTSLFSGLSGEYTRDKISWARTVDALLGQQLVRVNVPEDYQASAFIDFSTPIRRLAITLNAGVNESWNRGMSYINNQTNINTTWNHTFSLSIENRKKNKWDVGAGGSVQWSDARYSIQDAGNKSYLNLNYFAEASFTPNNTWNFTLKGDVTRYDARGFSRSVEIPLLKAEISYSFLKDKRGMLKLEAYDILDKNTGLERISELNYLVERQSNTIGRYVMLSFKYKLNRFGNDNGVDIKMKKR